MKVYVKLIPYFKETIPPEIDKIFVDLSGNLRLDADDKRRTLAIADIRICQMKSADEFETASYYIFALSGEDRQDGQLTAKVEDFVEKQRDSAPSSDSLWHSFQFAGFGAAWRQDQRAMYSQGLPIAIGSNLTQNLSDDEKQQILLRVEDRLSVLKEDLLNKLSLSSVQPTWADAKRKIEEMKKSEIPPCERFDFDYGSDSIVKSGALEENYHLARLVVDPDSIRFSTDRLGQIIENFAPVDCFCENPDEDFTWQEYLQAKRDHFANVIDWDDLLAICQRHSIDLRHQQADELGFTLKFRSKLPKQDFKTVTDYFWRYRQFSHFTSHAVKRADKLSWEEMVAKITTISRKKAWASRKWSPGTFAEFTNENCDFSKICLSSSTLRWILNENHLNIDKLHLNADDENCEEDCFSWKLRQAGFSYSKVCQDAFQAGVDDLDILARKLRHGRLSLSLLFPSDDSNDDRCCRKIYSSLRLYNIQEALQVEQAVCRVRTFLRRNRDVVRDSLQRLLFDEALEATSLYTGLWPPPAPFRNRAVSFFPQCAADNAAPAIRSLVMSSGTAGAVVKSVSVDWYQAGACDGVGLCDRSLCDRCRRHFVQRLQTSIYSDVSQFYLDDI